MTTEPAAEASAEASVPLISAIIISYNTAELTLDCLRCLHADLGTTPAEVFVVDNASTDGSAAAIKDAFPNVILIENKENAGFGAANNQAIRRAKGAFLLLVNSDAMLKPGAVSALLEQMRRDDRTAVVGPKLLNADGSLQRSCYKFPGPARSVFENTLLTAAFPNHRIFGDYRGWDHDAPRQVDFAIGACLLVRKSAVDQVGLFDEAFFLYAEETDWLYRFHRAGWNIWFTPAGEVQHLCGASGLQQSDRVFVEFHRGQERFVRKHFGWHGLAIYRVAKIFGSVARLAVFSARSVLRPARRKSDRTEVARWARILAFTVGAKRQGLRDHA
jgi:GT2 family glycosyltransferase